MEKKEAKFLKTAAILRKKEMAMTAEMEKYVSIIQMEAKRDPLLARENAKKALIRTGVATSKGNLKKIIVSWE